MKTLVQKLRLIYVPFLLLFVAIVGGYTFLNWLLFVKFHVFSLKEDVVQIWIPLALPWIPIILWLRPRIKLLNLKRKKGGDLPGLYIMVAGFAMAVPTLVAQAYLETATGKLTQLENVGQMQGREASKYYTLKNIYIDKQNASVESRFDVSGKHNEDFNMSLYWTVPILNSHADSTGKCIAWYGVEYNDRISNRLSEEEKQKRFEEFAKKSEDEF